MYIVCTLNIISYDIANYCTFSSQDGVQECMCSVCERPLKYVHVHCIVFALRQPVRTVCQNKIIGVERGKE